MLGCPGIFSAEDDLRLWVRACPRSSSPASRFSYVPHRGTRRRDPRASMEMCRTFCSLIPGLHHRLPCRWSPTMVCWEVYCQVASWVMPAQPSLIQGIVTTTQWNGWILRSSFVLISAQQSFCQGVSLATLFLIKVSPDPESRMPVLISEEVWIGIATLPWWGESCFIAAEKRLVASRVSPLELAFLFPGFHLKALAFEHSMKMVWLSFLHLPQ